jgi:branched-chain amino acid transport system permease protein
MADLLEHVVAGLASGGIYGLLGLAIVLVNRTAGVLNFAQGEMAALSAFVCLALTDHGWSFWPALAATLALSFGGGVVLRQAVIRPLERGPLAALVVVTIGVALAINGLDRWIWGDAPRRFPSPFSTAPVTIGGASFPKVELWVIVVALASALVAGLLLTRTKIGLGLRAVADTVDEARLAGVRAPVLLAVGWGISAALGAVAGVLAASSALVVEPSLMRTVLLYAFAAAVLGGIESPLGAVVGGLVLGVVLSLSSAYVHWVGTGLRPALALAVLLVVLLVRPYGLVGRPAVTGR